MSSPYYDQDGITIYHGDARRLVPQLGLSIGNFVLADPPYGARLSFDYNERFSPAQGKWWSNRDRAETQRYPPMIGDDEDFDPIFLLGNPRIVLWGANHYASRLPNSGGWIVWDKRAGKRNVAGCSWPMSEAELAWTNLSNGVRIFRHTWFGLIRDSELGQRHHCTQKPVALMRWILEKWNRSDLPVLDPYCGSGPVLIAARELKMRAVGIEIEERYCEIAAGRMDKHRALEEA